MTHVVHAVLTLGLVLACGGRGREVDGWVEIRGQRVAVELADTVPKQSLGLGGRDALEWDRGMLFPYPQAGFYSFWMKDMRFDIDIVWILRDRIVDLHHRVPHAPEREAGRELPVYRPRRAADTVLEVPAGYAQAHGWRDGDRVIRGGGAPR